MPMIDAILKELEQESAATRRVLERVPEDKLGWKPHEKSMTLGLLATHIATAPGNMARMISCDTFEFTEDYKLKPAASHAELMQAFEASLAEAKRTLAQFDDESLGRLWTAKKGGVVAAQLPRMACLRSILLNHLYHHRGQLSVYLRLLDVPVPAIYGPSADENPWKK
ncbi:MAG: DinB family protein [Bryobacteraceae bacterium]